jgi:hypothetical protein
MRKPGKTHAKMRDENVMELRPGNQKNVVKTEKPSHVRPPGEALQFKLRAGRG